MCKKVLGGLLSECQEGEVGLHVNINARPYEKEYA